MIVKALTPLLERGVEKKSKWVRVLFAEARVCAFIAVLALIDAFQHQQHALNSNDSAGDIWVGHNYFITAIICAVLAVGFRIWAPILERREARK